MITICEGCPCLNSSEDGDDCNLDYFTHYGIFKAGGQTYLTNCRLYEIEHGDGKFYRPLRTKEQPEPPKPLTEADCATRKMWQDLLRKESTGPDIFI